MAKNKRDERTPLSLNPDGSIYIGLPPEVRAFMQDRAQEVATTLNDPADEGYGRLCGPVDPSLDDDDPLVRLERQMSIESLCNLVSQSADKEDLTAPEAEAWLQVLTMAASILATRLGLYEQDSTESLDPITKMYFSLSGSLQCALALALDPDL
jgi:hypothetical protein